MGFLQLLLPVISYVHLRLIISLAFTHRHLLKQGDVKNVFYQATFSITEYIVVSPPRKVALSLSLQIIASTQIYSWSSSGASLLAS